MGWSSANPIFDKTARALLDYGVDSSAITYTLIRLCKELQDHEGER